MNKAIEIQSPDEVIVPEGYIIIFLAGSIEMGVAERWQESLQDMLSDLPIVFLNPRRDSWDSTWEQSIDNPLFKEQVDWELDGIEMADRVVFYFDSNTSSPITMLELGINSRMNNSIVRCEKPFWRKGNVDILCDRFSIPKVKDLDEMANYIKNKLK
jgi:hypothetical protein